MIVTRTEARLQGLPQYYTGRPCKRGHLSPRLVSSCSCVQCQKEWRDAHRDYHAEYYQQHKSDILSRQRENYHSDPEKHRAKARDWGISNRPKRNARKSKWRADRISRTPPWADLEKINQIYLDCPPEQTVDHEIPLRGTHVSGLHVENNLTYLSPEDNSSKGNRFDYWWK